MTRIEVFFAVMAATVFVAVLEFVRRRKLLEVFALLWLGVAVAGVVIAIFRSWVDRLATFVGISAGANLYFGGGLLFFLFVSMHLSLHVSQLESQVEILAEEVAALRGTLPPNAEPEPVAAPQG